MCLLYEFLLIKADNEGINVYEKEIGKLKGLYFDGNIIINSSIETNSEKACILAEELGHHYTTHGNILNQCKVENRKQERRARAWAYERLVSLNSLIEASKHCIRNRFELAEFLGVSERFIDEAIQYYKEKYGICHKVGDYIVYFEPLGVLKKVQKE
ncbi:phage protein [Thermoclostridium stercorarium subsp. stercorarium DSM 8532]|uniref:Phage protein n=1 Tax=Thermoclostridium stercorarium (strain ATCC 35414 / DSM 8532 / NCIMB 11754) TaxID=1121335 RepID=L7VPB9_THES1|nr:phage protein [Thermoclostridium stercorarium subsp. stercorarium DSM 8532]